MKYFSIVIFIFLFGLACATDFIPISENAYIHVSYMNISGEKYPSNGLLVKTNNGYLLLDTACNEQQTQDILDFVNSKLRSKIIGCIVTHSHIDRVGGIALLLQNNIDVYSTKQTRDLCIKSKIVGANKDLLLGKIEIDGQMLDIEYYGPAHSQDNIVIIVNSKNIMYAACIAKSIDSVSIGNIEDADIPNWYIVINKLIEICKKRDYYIIPGHGNYGKIELLYRTKIILEENIKY